MPYEWVVKIEKAPDFSGAFAPDEQRLLAELHLWPYRSLPKKGFVVVILITAALLLVPLIGVLGTPVLWGLLPFVVLAVAALWHALNRSYRDGEVLERLRLWPGRILLERQSRSGRQDWEANPHWVRVTLHQTGGPIPNYVTLGGAGREVEIGAFLSEEERIALAGELRSLLARV